MLFLVKLLDNPVGFRPYIYEKNRKGINKQRRYMWDRWMEGVRERRRQGDGRRK